MGAWATGSFDNDDAADWLASLAAHDDLGFVRETIAAVLRADGHVEAPDATCALAAIETFAAALGRATPAAHANAGLRRWIARVRPAADAAMTADALAALDRITDADSELRDLWEDSDAFDAWLAGVAVLRARLEA